MGNIHRIYLSFRCCRYVFLMLSVLFVSLAGCKPSGRGTKDCWVVDVKKQMGHLAMLDLADEIASVSYVSLQVTDDDASLIDGIVCFALSKDYIYVIPAKESRVVLFDRQGKFIKTLIPFGQGPGELQEIVSTIQADEAGNRLYLSGAGSIWVYTLDGTFVGQHRHEYQCLYQYNVGGNAFATVGMPYIPFRNGGFGIGAFTLEGDTLFRKADFPSASVPPERLGFTLRAAAAYSDVSRSVLFKTGGNDTVFQIKKATGISPACVLQMHISDDEVHASLDAGDFSLVMNQFDEAGNLNIENGDLYVYDMFETYRKYYFRFMGCGEYYVGSLDKETGDFQLEECYHPGSLREMADAGLSHGMLGTRSYYGFPVWGQVLGDELVQVVTPGDLSLYTREDKVSVPEDMPMEEDGNPVLVFYKLKK